MSEKPFWEGKTGEELAGLHVKVTFETGAVAEGILNDDRCIHLGSYSFFRVFGSGHDGLVEPATPIKSIELVDDPECERIDDINAVRVGDVYVGTDGNRYPVVGLAEFADYPLRVKVSGGACLPHRDYFAYALRPKPKLPDHDGLWFDKYGALWMFSATRKARGRLNPLPSRDCTRSLRSARPRRWKHEHRGRPNIPKQPEC